MATPRSVECAAIGYRGGAAGGGSSSAISGTCRAHTSTPEHTRARVTRAPAPCSIPRSARAEFPRTGRAKISLTATSRSELRSSTSRKIDAQSMFGSFRGRSPKSPERARFPRTYPRSPAKQFSSFPRRAAVATAIRPSWDRDLVTVAGLRNGRRI